MDGGNILWLFLIQLLALRTSCQDTATCTNQTINDFWHESTQSSCGIVNVRNAFEIYNKVAKSNSTGDQFSGLLKHQIAKSLNELLVQEIVDSIANGMLKDTINIEILERELHKSDVALARAVWANALEELLERNIEVPQIIEQVFTLTNGKLKFAVIEHYWRHYDSHFKQNSQFLPIITYATVTLLQECSELTTHQAINADAILKQLPQQLIDLYQSSQYNVSFLNRHHNEYMYADQNKGPTPQKRLVFTFTPTPHSLKVKGKFKLHFNSRGMMALSVFSKSGQKYLKSDSESIYYCPDCEDPNSSSPPQLWNILWPFESLRGNGEEQYIYLQHSGSGNLLCATNAYDSNRRWLQILSVKEYITMESCQWKVIKASR